MPPRQSAAPMRELHRPTRTEMPEACASHRLVQRDECAERVCGLPVIQAFAQRHAIGECGPGIESPPVLIGYRTNWSTAKVALAIHAARQCQNLCQAAIIAAPDHMFSGQS